MDDKYTSRFIERLDDIDDCLKTIEHQLHIIADQLDLMVEAMGRFRATQLRQDAILDLKRPGGEPPA